MVRSTIDPPTERDAAIADTMADIRTIEAANQPDGPTTITRAGVTAIRDRLLELAAQRELFPLAAFPPPDGGARSALYRLSQDPDDRFALYAQVTDGPITSPPHDHRTWAVVVGFHGQELNRFYDRIEVDGVPGVRQRADHVVEAGTGVAMLPTDVHSIHIDGPSLNFHCYGLALERLVDREYYHAKDRAWKPFSSTGAIRDLPR
ncbi:MAG: hypothetical protein AAF547_13485 [Actinomycetota bacterium]